MAHNDANKANLSKKTSAYELLLKTCHSLYPQKKASEPLEKDFFNLSSQLHKKVEDFKNEISKMPLIAMILFWADLIQKDQIFGDRYLSMMQKLIETGLLPCKSEHQKFIVLRDLSSQDPTKIINQIRSFQGWPIDKREDYVLVYSAFASWLAQETFGCFPEAKDLDRETTRKRRLSFDSYIEILKHLDLREQILAKIFYLGGHRNLEEVLSLKIENIDFAKQHLLFSDEEVFYPSHVFEDLKTFIQGRKTGFVFSGKDGERISHTTPFRALKSAVVELGLDQAFTFKDFAKDF
jgi:hypothetical protein